MQSLSRLSLVFIVGISFLLGWGIHASFSTNSTLPNTPSSSLPTAIEQLSCEESLTPEIVEKVVIKEVVKFVPKVKIVYKIKPKEEDANSSKDLFVIALAKDKFYDAMSYYDEADEEKHYGYQKLLLAYFAKVQNRELERAIEEMQYFIEVESESKLIVFQLAQLFSQHERYKEALNLMVEFSYIASYDDRNIINSIIKSISVSYIAKMTSANSFENLIEFLKDRVNIGILSDFYSFELAKLYLKLKKYIPSLEILEEVQRSDTYKEQATEMITFIQNKIEEQEEYPIQIPLIRYGLHFLVKVYVNNTPLLLLVDTGASTTSVNYDKVSHLKVLRENVKFHTAGGDIYETIFQADSFTVDSVTLENFKISGLHFSGGDKDGLLGMNFLGRFKFKIDQQEGVLFLGDKN